MPLITDLKAFEEALGERLVATGKLDAGALLRARSVRQETDEPLHRLMPKLGLVAEGDLARAMANVLGLALMLPEDVPDTVLLGEHFRPEFLRNAGALILSEDDDCVLVALTDPLNEFVLQAVQNLAGKVVKVRIAIPAELEQAILRVHGSAEEISAVATVGVDDGIDLAADVARLRDLASGAPVIRLVGQMIARAVEMRASDIHIEPFENMLRVRFRLDGHLREVMSPPLSMHAALVSRIKIMANLDIAERRLPQDGRVNTSVRGAPVDLRVSIIPGFGGETVVLRVLDRNTVRLSFDALGISADHQSQLDRLFAQPHGIVLVTGPTGSGKTTSLYAALSKLNVPDVKILTVEDPIEYQISGINQVQVKPSIGLTFPYVLRSFLRQDPDILMVGEIRDAETAEIAVQAALTGHLVFSTLHTNDAASSVVRLTDMGIDNYLVSSTLIGVVAQRLVRRLCEECKEPIQLTPEMVEHFQLAELDQNQKLPKHIHRAAGAGCEKCGQTGYRGRTALLEVLEMNDEIGRLVLQNISVTSLREAAIDAGMTTLYADGMRRVLAGDTTIEEVLRVAKR
ncbi:ATPase, T2SS/T4P/T4SS family [Thalassospira sp.]|uniref:GspE/PulE family protein n=1 Tax=Thalassospira sp. TaxID=1912094 RepID=UPI0032ED4E83